MTRHRFMRIRAIAVRAVAAIAALAAGVLLASLPGLSESFRLGFAGVGFAGFVWLSRSALRSWLGDWQELWQSPSAYRSTTESPQRGHQTPRLRLKG
jgi:hypothetical protein